MYYLFWVLVHVVGVFGYQYTGEFWFLAPALFHIALSTFVYVFGVAALMAPNVDTNDTNYALKKDYGNRFLLQIGVIVTSSQLFMIGYAFVAGLAMIQAVTLACSIILQKITEK
jgi:hypothetical protein